MSRAYGARKCGTHTPNASRSGVLSGDLKAGLKHAGYPLQTTSISPPGLIEVYPHPALLELAQRQNVSATKPAKFAATGRADAATRKNSLFREWGRIVKLLDCQIAGVANALPPLPPNARGAEIKAFEDMLDAVVCAWSGFVRCTARETFCDGCSAIWIPTADVLIRLPTPLATSQSPRSFLTPRPWM